MSRSESERTPTTAGAPNEATPPEGWSSRVLRNRILRTRIPTAILAASVLSTAPGCVIFDLIFGPSEPEVPERHNDPLGPSDSDSESLRCPVTGAEVHPDSAIAFVHNGKTYYLRDTDALEEFKRDPDKYLKP